MDGATCTEGIDIIWPAPRLEAENDKLLLDAGEALVPVDRRGPLAEDAENTGAEVLSVDMPPTTCVGGTEDGMFPTACVGGTKDKMLPMASLGGTENEVIPTTCVGATLNVFPTACVGGTEKDGSSTSRGEVP